MNKVKKLKKIYNKEEKRHDKAYEKENSLHEKRHRKEENDALKVGMKPSKRKYKKKPQE